MNKLVLSILTVIVFTSCNKERKEAESKVDKVQEHWSYDGETSPEHWAEIEINSDCSGQHQSPINIIEHNTTLNANDENSLKLLYDPETHFIDVKNNGHSIEIDFEKGDSIKYKNEIYHLKQIHFHEPSEHTINGIRYPIEIHLVHKSKKNHFTVLSMLGEEGREKLLFINLENILPLKVGETKKIDKAVDLLKILPETKSFYSYNGSLTTPPCTEKVNWVIFKQPIQISLKEVVEIKKNMPLNNYRFEQPLNDRKVYFNNYTLSR